ncbi:hypothetical protein AMELA_G00121840 [Ameiurus melas]|uniref:Uncharacterized protein n=1 Tax=Ameiurus melas TaxID=219545 RepID=A0A7J6ALS6_AMEME|nr:hypothetical protein AMELA_G00121840 [Ameiurus melas]
MCEEGRTLESKVRNGRKSGEKTRSKGASFRVLVPQSRGDGTGVGKRAASPCNCHMLEEPSVAHSIYLMKTHILPVFNTQLHGVLVTIGVVEDSNSMTPGSVEQFWCNTRHGRRQQLKHVAEPLSRYVLPRYPVELPKLNMAAPTPKVPYPVSSLPALAIPHQGLLPAITSKKCHSRSMKPKEESHRSTLKSYYMPPLERKGGGY